MMNECRQGNKFKTMLLVGALSLGVGVSASAQMEPSSSFYDPVPAPSGDTISATPRDPAPISLRPVVDCEENVCTIKMKTKWGGSTSISEPLAYEGSLYAGDDWFPRAISEEELEARGPDGASYGWTVGYDEGETDIFVTDIKEDPYADAMSGRFIVEQWAGFEHIGRHIRVLATDYETGELYTALDLPHANGPVRVSVEPHLNEGVLVRYDWLDDTIPTPYPGSIFYDWTKTPESDGREILAVIEETDNDHFDEFSQE